MRPRLRDRLLLLLGTVVLACALAACAAPTPQGAQQAAATATPEAAPAQPPAPARTPPALDKLKPRTGGPLPPRVASSPVRIDRRCGSDADCAVKDVGNCCGAAPACVNVDSPTDPKAVQAECARKGMASICGFKPIDHCQCVQGECQGEIMMTEAQ